MKIFTAMILFLFVPVLTFAGQQNDGASVANLTGTLYGYLGILVFIAAYALVPLENKIHLRKSKPVLMAAGVIWVLIAIAYISIGDTHTAHEAIKSNLLEYAELFLFLLTAMTYINAMEERNVFQALRAFLVSRGFSLKMIFWVTGLLAFFISPIADNLTTALLMGAVVMAVGGNNKKFVALACINTVVAANAGGAFSPFGDITTLMVWQKGKVEFAEFFLIFIPSIVNWLVPAIVMNFAISNAKPEVAKEKILMKYGTWGIIVLFLCTITTAVTFHNFLHLPPAAGMMLGLGYLGAYSYYIKRYEGQAERYDYILGARGSESMYPLSNIIKSENPPGKNIDSLPVAAFAIDTSHTITHWNRAMKNLTGIPASEAIGTKNQWKPFYQEQRPVLADLILNYMPGKEVEKHYEEQFRESPYIENAYDALDFFPSLGKDGKWLSFSAAPLNDPKGNTIGVVEVMEDFTESKQAAKQFDLMKNIARAEWDTLLFFYGVILCVGGLSQFGYLGLISHYMYADIGPTFANTMVGILSAVVDNIPVMFAVLTMDPVMSHGQWLLVTLTAGVGGSMLSIGSAAGVALMGTARGTYTFGIHLKWTPIIALGYAASILVHLLVNARLM
jgi:Na+/H+ antiporter NhaD/arsenite permease-like protein